jgi:endonuclease YncB( thermonuclease family)
VPTSLCFANQYPFTIHCFERQALLIILLFISIPAFAWEARGVAVSDGDTITIEPVQGGDRAKVRLHGIDAPELRQPYGEAAKTFTLNKTLFKEIDVPGAGILQELLLEAGLAWVYPAFCKDCNEWETIQEQARRQRKGLWAEKNPVEP